MNGSGGVPKIMVFRPTWEEFKDFNKYIAYMESCGAHKAGLAKVIPPPEWNPCPAGYDFDKIGDMVIPAPICQVVNGKQGLYQQLNIQKRAMTVRDFRKTAESTAYCTPSHFDFEDLERKYWKNITYVSPIYGADVSGSLTDPAVKEWNINKLGSILDFVSQDYDISIEGVNTAYLYFGMWKTSFAWHTEDMDLYSINYLHFGAPKSWYSIPPDHGPRLERCANGYFSSHFKECPAFLRHKMTIISPQILKNYSIPYNKITQEAGEFMITFPYGYHAGFNHGYNCAESTNFASVRWIEYGKRAVQCYCRDDMVRISMDTFVKRFQPEKYDLWIQGRDLGSHPSNPSRLTAANAPSIDDILCNKNNKSTVPEIFFKAQVPKRKATRHLIHKPRKEEPEKSEDKVEDAVKGEDATPVADTEPCTTETPSTEEEVPDEETVEFMKDIWYKAGEMDDEELNAMEAEEPKKKGSKGRKPKTAAVPEDVKLKRFKTEPTIKRIRKPSSEIAGPSSAPTVAIISKKSIAPLPDMLNQKLLTPGFKIPKKTLLEGPSGGPEPSGLLRDSHLDTSGSEASTTQWTLHHTAAHGRRDSGCIAQRDFSESADFVPPEPAAIQWSQVSPSVNKSEHPEVSKSSPSADLLDPNTWVADSDRQQIECSPGRSKYDDPYDSNKKRSRKQKSPRSNRCQPEHSPFGDEGVSSSASWRDADRQYWTLAQESDYNLYQSLHEPFCCVCNLLNPSMCAGNSSIPSHQWKRQADAYVQPTSSQVLIPEALFSRTDPKELVFEQHLESQNMMSTLYRCSTCRICVHGKCYGVPESTPVLDWLCRRCSACELSAVCCLCYQKGGALKPTSNGRWAHIVCVLSIPEAYFGFCGVREPAMVCNVNFSDPHRPQCIYCKRDDAACVQCSAKRCSAIYHVTCALDVGVKFAHIKGTVQNTCLRHLLRKSETAATAAPVSLGTKVWAKHPSYGRYFKARVTEDAANVTFYWVDFSDGTTSKDTYPEDILNYRCTEDGPPPLGAAVHVQWTDGKAYDGRFRGTIQRQTYKVTFRDATTISLERSEFYLLNESLPKKVRDLLTEVLELAKTDPGESSEQKSS